MKLFLLVLFYRVSTALFPGDYNFLIHLEVVYEEQRLAAKEADNQGNTEDEGWPEQEREVGVGFD